MRLFRRRQAAAPAAVDPPPTPPRPDRVKTLSPDGLRVAEFPAVWRTDLRLYGVRGSYGAIYRTQANVSAVIDKIAKDVGATKLKTYGKLPGSSPLEPTSRIELDESPLQALFEKPGGRVSPFRFRRALATDILIYDDAFLVKIRQGQQPAALVRVPVPSMIPVRNDITHAITAYRIAGRYDLGEIPLDDIVEFPGYDPEATSGSVASMEKLRRIIAEEQAVNDWREGFYRNSARREGLVERPAEADKWTDELREAWRSDLESTLSGADGSGRVALLEDGMVFKDTSWSPRDAEYAKARQLSRKEVAAHFGMPLSLAGATDGSPSKEERTQYITDLIVPLLTRIEDEINTQLVPEFDFGGAQRMYTQFNIDGKLRGSFEETAAVASTAVGGPVATVNEWRARLNLPPMEGGDEIFIPLNSVRGGGPQASPQAPVETPATGIEPAGTTPGGGTAPEKAAIVEELLKRNALTDAELRDFAGLPVARSDKAAPRIAIQRRTAAAEKYAAVLRKTFDRQARSLKSFTGQGRKDAADVNGDRWNRELADDLTKLSNDVVDETASRAKTQIKGTYDADRTRAYIATRSQIAADNINRQTAERLKDDEEDAFADADSRSASLGLGLATGFVAFARAEVAHQTQQAGKKTIQKEWIVTSDNSRHPELEGERVGIDEEFSNSAMWPGDPSLPESETAGCACLLNLVVTS